MSGFLTLWGVATLSLGALRDRSSLLLVTLIVLFFAFLFFATTRISRLR